MATLSSGVIVKLLEEVDSEENTTIDRRTPLLQVRSIIPVMEEGDLWPNRGFYLKVSDLSHAICVSLPNEYNEMILNNQLQLGQYIYVQKLESAAPVPILRGIKPLPGRHPCLGNPEDFIFTQDLIQSSSGLLFSDTDSKSEKSYVSRRSMERPRSASASRATKNLQGNPKSLGLRSIPLTPSNNCSRVNRTADAVKDISEISISCSDIDSDSDNSSVSSLYVKPKHIRRTWNGTKADLKELSASSIIMHEPKPTARSCSAGFPPYSSSRYDSSDDNSSCKSCSSYKSSIRRNTTPNSKVVRSSSQKKSSAMKEKRETPKPVVPQASFSDRKSTETVITWDSLSSKLVKLGKEVMQQRDTALTVAADALQEAYAAERLIQCLSTYSELQSTTPEKDPQSKVVRLLDLHDNMAQARSVTESLSMMSPLRTETYDADVVSPRKIKEAVKLTFERKKCALSWMKAALASDLSQFVATPVTSSLENAATSKRLSNPSGFQGTGGIRRQRKSAEFQFGLETVNENPADWVKGSSLHVFIDLDKALQIECRKWFLSSVEEYLDGIMSKTVSTESDSEVASVMCQIKRVDGWLDVMMSNEEAGENVTCQRLRNKLYTVLLKHVERSAIALENMSAQG